MPLTGQRLRREIEALFDVVPNRCTSEEVVFICPVPGCGDRSGNRSANLKNGKTSCWRCNRGGDFVRWSKSLGYNIDESGSAEPDITAVEEAMNAVDQPKLVAPVITDCRLPKGFTLLSDAPKSIYTKLIAEMAESKHLTQEDFERVRVGFTKRDPKWEPYAIFPVFEWGRVVYFQGRMYNAQPGEATKRFPARSEVPLGSKYWVYNIDAARNCAKTVIIVESILNVLSLERKLVQEGIYDVVPVCVFKHAVSAPQSAKLMSLRNVEEFCFMFDADATSEAWRFAERASNHRRVTVAEIPALDGRKTFDPNDDVEVAWGRFVERRRADVPSETIAKMLEGPTRPRYPESRRGSGQTSHPFHRR